MDLLSIIFIAIGLAMDCFAVSITKGISAGQGNGFKGLLMALLFGLFQGGMPLIGFYAGISFTEQISKYDHWIALGLLAIIGGKMIWESFHEEEETKTPDFKLRTLLLLAIATSIDALATGIIFVPTPDILWIAVSIIAFVSFAFAGIGFLIGRFFGTRFHFNVELIGGIILIAIGLKIFIEHMWC